MPSFLPTIVDCRHWTNTVKTFCQGFLNAFERIDLRWSPKRYSSRAVRRMISPNQGLHLWSCLYASEPVDYRPGSNVSLPGLCGTKNIYAQTEEPVREISAAPADAAPCTLAEQRLLFQSQELMTSKQASWIFLRGSTPRIIWRDVDEIRKLGGDVDFRVR